VQLQAVPDRLFVSLAHIDSLIIFVKDIDTSFLIYVDVRPFKIRATLPQEVPSIVPIYEFGIPKLAIGLDQDRSVS